jgi:predicted GH43/DUF377 family glycosyl hydrolase
MQIKRCSANPIVTPGLYDWRAVSTFNPGAIFHDGRFLLYERAAGGLKPFQTSIGLMESTDGVSFKHVTDKPVFTGEMLGYPGGSVEDARVVHLDDKFYMCYALQPYAFDCWPTGTGVPDYFPDHYPEWKQNNIPGMMTQSGIAVSDDGVTFEQLCYTTPREIDDRDNALFPEKIGGRYALLRRPMEYVGPEYGTDRPGIWLSYSDDLLTWSDPVLVAVAENEAWEGTKIGAAATPLRTDAGWLVLYHGVDEQSIYRVGALMLDIDDPSKVVGRTKNWIMEPETYYEKSGLVIPNVIFPTANLIVDNDLWMYYGCCDTCIGLATVPIQQVLDVLG